MNMAGNSRYSF